MVETRSMRVRRLARERQVRRRANLTTEEVAANRECNRSAQRKSRRSQSTARGKAIRERDRSAHRKARRSQSTATANARANLQQEALSILLQNPTPSLAERHTGIPKSQCLHRAWSGI